MDNNTTTTMSPEQIRDAFKNATQIKQKLIAEKKALIEERKALLDPFKEKIDKLDNEYFSIFGTKMPVR